MGNTDLFCRNCGITLKDWTKTDYCLICKTKLVPVTANMPECPTCHSKCILPIKQTRRTFNLWMFGVANPTARAQFECRNCGYKW